MIEIDLESIQQKPLKETHQMAVFFKEKGEWNQMAPRCVVDFYSVAIIDALLMENIRLRGRAEITEDALVGIQAKAHDASSGPTVPDLLWEIRGIAQGALC
jgi:hypothetical protein